MKRSNNLFRSLLILLVLTLATLIPTSVSQIEHGPAAAVLPDISVAPAYQATSVGNEVTVDIKIANAVGVYAWQVRLVFDGDILLVQTVTEGPWLKSQAPAGTLFIKKVFNNLGATSYIDATCTAIGTFTGASGSGTLFIIKFIAQDVGVSPIDVRKTSLTDPSGADLQHTVTDGTVDVDSYMLTPDRYIELINCHVSNRHFDISQMGNEFTFYAKVKNWADIPLLARVTFSGPKDGEDFKVITNMELVEPSHMSHFLTYTMYLDPGVDVGLYHLNVYAEYSFYGYKWYTSELGKCKDLSFTIEP